jgi:hypothetical protein
MDTIPPVESHLTPCGVPHFCPTGGRLALSVRRPRRRGTTVTLGHRLHRPAMLTFDTSPASPPVWSGRGASVPAGRQRRLDFHVGATAREAVAQDRSHQHGCNQTQDARADSGET